MAGRKIKTKSEKNRNRKKGKKKKWRRIGEGGGTKETNVGKVNDRKPNMAGTKKKSDMLNTTR